MTSFRLMTIFLLAFFTIYANCQVETSDNTATNNNKSDTQGETAVILTAILCGIGLLLFCGGVAACCYLKCCTGDGCVV